MSSTVRRGEADYPQAHKVRPSKTEFLREGEGLVALYHDDTATIFLPETWTGSIAAEMSILVHELVHHLQNEANLKFECAAEREQMAYEAQERWLRLFGDNLLASFDLDPLSIFIRTRCMLH